MNKRETRDQPRKRPSRRCFVEVAARHWILCECRTKQIPFPSCLSPPPCDSICDFESESVNKGLMPVVILSCGDYSFPCLLDTGSQVTVIDTRVFKQVQSSKYIQAIFSLAGVKIVGAFGPRKQGAKFQVNLRASLSDCWLDLDCLVLDDVIFPCILGMVMLSKYRAEVSVKNGWLDFMFNGELVRVVFCEVPCTYGVESSAGLVMSNNRLPLEVSSALVLGICALEARRQVKLENEVQTKFDEMLSKFTSLFTKTPGLITDYVVSLEVVSQEVFTSPQFSIPHALRSAVRDEIDKLLRLGIIEESMSEYCQPLVTAFKKNGEVRVCLDCRKLNKVLKAVQELPRTVQDVLQQLGSGRIFSRLDLNKAYYQLPVRQTDRHLLAFRFEGKLFQFTVLPFGLKTAVAHFSRCMRQVFKGCEGKFVHCYLDDILIISESVEEHVRHLKIVFDRLQAIGMTLNREKCEFFVNEFVFLGYLVSEDGIRADPKKRHGCSKLPGT